MSAQFPSRRCCFWLWKISRIANPHLCSACHDGVEDLPLLLVRRPKKEEKTANSEYWTNTEIEEKDLIIIGGGVAGYVAAIKAGQEGMKVRHCQICSAGDIQKLTVFCV